MHSFSFQGTKSGARIVNNKTFKKYVFSEVRPQEIKWGLKTDYFGIKEENNIELSKLKIVYIYI